MSNLTSIARSGVTDLPVYEAGKPLDEVARELGFSPDELVKLASNENALGPSPKALQAMAVAGHEMHRYPDGNAHYLRSALAEQLGVAVDHVVPGNGSNELIELLAHVFLGPDTSVVVADRAFIMYRVVTAAFRSRLVPVPMTEFTHDLDAMGEAISPDTRLVFVSNPNNPTGTMVDGTALDRFMDIVPDHVVVVLDEAYIELLPPERRPDTLKYVREERNVFVLRTFSKSYGLAGLRLGYAVAPAEGIQLLQRVRQPFNVNAMAQAAALAALQDTEHLARTRAMVKSGLAGLSAALDELGLTWVPSVANFMLVRVGNGRDVFEQLLARKVIVRAMDAYQLPEYVRVTVGTDADNEKLVAALADLIHENVLKV